MTVKMIKFLMVFAGLFVWQSIFCWKGGETTAIVPREHVEERREIDLTKSGFFTAEDFGIVGEEERDLGNAGNYLEIGEGKPQTGKVTPPSDDSDDEKEEEAEALVEDLSEEYAQKNGYIVDGFITVKGVKHFTDRKHWYKGKSKDVALSLEKKDTLARKKSNIKTQAKKKIVKKKVCRKKLEEAAEEGRVQPQIKKDLPAIIVEPKEGKGKEKEAKNEISQREVEEGKRKLQKKLERIKIEAREKKKEELQPRKPLPTIQEALNEVMTSKFPEEKMKELRDQFISAGFSSRNEYANCVLSPDEDKDASEKEQTYAHWVFGKDARSAVVGLKFLTKFGNDMNVKDGQGCTPLHLAMLQSNPEAVKFLAGTGVDPDCVNDEGDTPLLALLKDLNFNWEQSGSYSVFSETTFALKDAVKSIKEYFKLEPDLTIQNKKGESVLSILKKKKSKSNSIPGSIREAIELYTLEHSEKCKQPSNMCVLS